MLRNSQSDHADLVSQFQHELNSMRNHPDALYQFLHGLRTYTKQNIAEEIEIPPFNDNDRPKSAVDLLLMDIGDTENERNDKYFIQESPFLKQIVK